ncbi:hypothetical protein V6N12_009883 [Hibiscus sabdariffa]|uniref:Uncharacterized protein n=1 Tax=Hibiscus sabdariffa TaxID=183260 RepID=A0ABR2ECG7_9ROSI
MDSNQPQPQPFIPSASKLPIKSKAALPPKLEFQPIILPKPHLSNSNKSGLSPMVISSRLARGLNPSSFSPHDQALFDLSRRLWGPEFASTSPFGNNSSGFSHDLESNGVDGDMNDNDNEASLHYEFSAGRDEVINGEAIDGVLGKSVLNVFDECIYE